jgi:membrane fusion protein (multidrug efflux system)
MRVPGEGSGDGSARQSPNTHDVALDAEKGEAPQIKRIPAAKPPPPRTEEAPAHPDTTARLSHGRWLRWALFALLSLALIVGGYWYISGGQVMSTDDAYIQADRVGISTDVLGTVQDVAVTENQKRYRRAGSLSARSAPVSNRAR